MGPLADHECQHGGDERVGRSPFAVRAQLLGHADTPLERSQRSFLSYERLGSWLLPRTELQGSVCQCLVSVTGCVAHGWLPLLEMYVLWNVTTADLPALARCPVTVDLYRAGAA
jgi:hypothetical protein